MGNIKKVLAVSTDNHFYFENDLRIEQAEFMHIHWRDVRILMNNNQFPQFVSTLISSIEKWDGTIGGSDNPLVTIPITDGTIFKNIISLEEQQNGDFHFHYQDIRIELSRESFLRLADLFIKAKAEL